MIVVEASVAFLNSTYRFLNNKVIWCLCVFAEFFHSSKYLIHYEYLMCTNSFLLFVQKYIRNCFFVIFYILNTTNRLGEAPSEN